MKRVKLLCIAIIVFSIAVPAFLFVAHYSKYKNEKNHVEICTICQFNENKNKQIDNLSQATTNYFISPFFILIAIIGVVFALNIKKSLILLKIRLNN